MAGETQSTARIAAAKLIQELRQENGAITPDEREELRLKFPKILASFEQLQRTAGRTTQLLVHQLYSSDARFVYELIQNAEDTSFDRAKRRGELPFIRFALAPTVLIVDTNEDGFREQDVRAICTAAKSTKAAGGYIGEKGIGFKSVFKVARQVHIQSEPYSFEFKYDSKSGDTGLGLITPIEKEYGTLPEDVQTRMVLTLQDDQDFETRAEELQSIPNTFLLFVKQLQVLTVMIEYPDGKVKAWRYTREVGGVHKEIESIVTARTSSNEAGDAERKRFIVTRTHRDNLSEHTARKNIHSAEVVLAFPITEDFDPIIEQQHVFAYLPLRQVGFKFLIQSDFITAANREDIINHKRNEDLRSGVAEAFQKAVLAFAKHDPLQYRWMRYLPDNKIADPFWAKLRPDIHQLLRTTPILRPWSGSGLYRPLDLYFVTGDSRDRNFDPLFPDLRPETYLAKGYIEADWKRLEDIGCDALSMDGFLDRAAADLKKDCETSRMKNPDTSDDWHRRVATLLKLCFEKGWHTCMMKIYEFELIPLISGDWVATKKPYPYFPADIPHDLGLPLVKAEALKCEVRKALFARLCVADCDTKVVIDTIYEKHRKSDWETSALSDLVKHMRYLYHHVPEAIESLDKDMKVAACSKGEVERICPAATRVYFNAPDDPYGATQLYAEISPEIPGCSVWILSPLYAEDCPASGRGFSWWSWLESVAGIRTFPPVCGGDGLSKEFQYLAQHRPDMLLMVLKKYWSRYVPQYKVFKTMLMETEISSASGKLVEIWRAYMPFTELVEKAERFGLGKSPFLPLSMEAVNDRDEWEFLKELGVGFKEDLDFYLDALDHQSSLKGIEIDVNVVFEIYAGLEDMAVSDQDYCRTYFEKGLILIPEMDGEPAKWVSLNQCRWDGPEWLVTKHCLASIAQYQDFSKLFKTILGLNDADTKDSLEELEYMKEEWVEDPREVADIYRYLWHDVTDDASADQLRSVFEEKGLLFVPGRKDWFPPSACIWADETTTLLDSVSVSTSYPGLEDFFCKVLAIPKPDVAMRVKALKALATKQKVDQIKLEIMAIAALEPSAAELKSLRKTSIFSVRTGNADLQLTNSESDWVIMDRQEYADAFEGQAIHVLDYSMSEIQKARRFLEAMELDNKFVLNAIEEKTMVEGGGMNTSLTFAMRIKAYAFYRCGRHFGGTRFGSNGSKLFEVLSNIAVYESDTITKSIQLTQYGTPFTAGSRPSKIHIEDDSEDDHGRLKFYVPKEKKDRAACYLFHLPQELTKFLDTTDTRANSVFKSVLCATDLDVIDMVLLDEGIPELDGVQRPTHAELPPQSPAGDGSFAIGSPSGSPRNNRTQPPRSPFGASVNGDVPGSSTWKSHANRFTAASANEHFRNTLDGAPGSPSARDRDSVAGYEDILSHVILAGEEAVFPQVNTYYQNSADTDGPLPRFHSLDFGSPLLHDLSVGAAGELFVFNLLKASNLPHFNTDNWQSGIRHLVRVHQDYSDLSRWSGYETADLTYHDTTGELTRILEAKGYLQPGQVASSPEYYFEVKTTTEDCSQALYMSDNQYRMMQDYRLPTPPDSTPAEKVLILFRVFHVDRPHLSLRLYVDPDTHRTNGTLSFQPMRWSVRSAA